MLLLLLLPSLVLALLATASAHASPCRPSPTLNPQHLTPQPLTPNPQTPHPQAPQPLTPNTPQPQTLNPRLLRSYPLQTFTDVWVLALVTGAWSRLPAVGEGLRGMAMSDFLLPHSPGSRGETSPALLVFGVISLQKGGEGDAEGEGESAGGAGLLRGQGAKAGGSSRDARCTPTPATPLTPGTAQGSTCSLGHAGGDARRCLALCSLERLVCPKGSLSPRTAMGYSAWSPGSPRSMVASALSTRAAPSPTPAGAPSSVKAAQRSLDFPVVDGGWGRGGGVAGEEVSSRGRLPEEFAGSPWSRRKERGDRQLLLAREVARVSDDVARAVPLDSRQHLRGWEELLSKVDGLVGQLAIVGQAVSCV